jgi:hypothetical protein
VIAAAATGSRRWAGTLGFGEIDVTVRIAGTVPAAWPDADRMRIVATEPDRGGAGGAGALLAAMPGAERAYRLLVEALSAEGLAAVLDPGDGSRAGRLRAAGGALVVEVAGAAGGAPDAEAPTDEELALALTLLRAFPRAITPSDRGAGEPSGPAAPAAVVDLADRRRARAEAAAAAASRG